jgi:tol-pal system protein YbgF
MTVCSTLPRLSLVFFLVVTSGPAARAQDDRTQERLDRIERDLNMLQRQVYRGGGEPAVSADPGIAVNTQLRLDRLEEQMRDLTGRIEDATNRVQQVRQRLEQLNGDVEARFNTAAAPPGTGATPPPGRLGPEAAAAPRPLVRPGLPPVRSGPGVAELTPPGTLTPPGSVVPAPPGPTQLAPPATTQLTLATPGPGTLPAGSATEQYNFAFGLLKQADYPAAEQALKAFIRQHPRDPLVANAEYWLGETYYARGRYPEAAAVFAETYKNYPKGAKAAENLIGLAKSLEGANKRQDACLALRQLDHDFPHPASAIRERASAEKKKAGC